MSDKKVTKKSTTQNNNLPKDETGKLGGKDVTSKKTKEMNAIVKYIIDIHKPIPLETRDLKYEDPNDAGILDEYLTTYNGISLMFFGLVGGSTIVKSRSNESSVSFLKRFVPQMILFLYAGYMTPNILSRHGKDLLNILSYLITFIKEIHRPIRFDNDEANDLSLKPNFIGAVIGFLLVAYMIKNKSIDQSTGESLIRKIAITLMGGYSGFVLPNGLNILATLYGGDQHDPN